jgi:di/tripeptidase
LLTLIAILFFTATINAQPTPNLFTGGHHFHGKLEFNSARGLAKTTETLVNLVQIFAEKGM